jgi:hypothetical protein
MVISNSTERSIHPFHRYLLKGYEVPYRVQEAKKIALSKEEQISTLTEYILGEVDS